MKNVGLIVNHGKLEALQFAGEVIAWLTEKDVAVRLDHSSAPLLGRDDLAADPDELAELDLLITLGGDGTILAASHIAASRGVPILGVHMGHFGFIAEAHPNELLTRLDEVLAGDAAIEERMMVQGDVLRGGEVVHGYSGLNDVVINKGTRARMLVLRMSFNADFVADYPADGVVVATPTGSTAYALSTGGPLIEPTVQALLVAPICPHSLAARPLVIPATEVITLEVDSDGGEVLFSADGSSLFPLAPGDVVRVRRAECTTRIVRLQKSSFYRKVRKRLLWAERLNA